MKRRILVALLALFTLLAFESLAQAGISTDARQNAALAALEARIEAGEPINGVENAFLARMGVMSKAASTFSLSATPGELCTEAAYTQYGYTNPLCWNHPLLLSGLDPSVTLTQVTSSKPEVVEVVPPVSGGDPYFLKGLKRGTATITVIASNGKTARKKITVKNKVLISSFDVFAGTPVDPAACLSISEVIYYQFSDELGHDYPSQGFPLYAVAQPTSASFAGQTTAHTPQAASFSSNNPNVALVSEVARNYCAWVWTQKLGTANITIRATDGGRAKGTFKVIVKGRPATDIEQIADLFMQPGATRFLKPEVNPSEAWDKTLTWSTSNRKVAIVNAEGNVTAVAPGTATITYKNAPSGLKRSFKVTVGYGKAASGTTYRFYTTDGAIPFYSMEQLNSTFLMGVAFYSPYGEANIHTQQITYLSDFHSTLNALPTGGADEDDVTVVYLAANGIFNPWIPGLNGALNDMGGGTPLKVDEIRTALEKVPGTVILIVDADCSGEFITSKGAAASKARVLARQKAFADVWTKAFAASKATNYVQKGLADSQVRSKFKVLVSCSASGNAYLKTTGQTYQYLRFTYWLGKGLGVNFGGGDIALPGDPMTAPANANPRKDSVVTLAELYKYVKANMQKEATAANWQTVSVWPANDPTAIINMTL